MDTCGIEAKKTDGKVELLTEEEMSDILSGKIKPEYDVSKGCYKLL